MPSFFSSWVWIEHPAHVGAVQAARTLKAVRRGDAQGWKGKAGMAATAVSWIGLADLMRKNLAATEEIEASLEAAGVDPAPADRAVPVASLAGVIATTPRGVKVRRGVTFSEIDGQELKLDVHSPKETLPPGQRRPAILQIHGGAWIIGDKREQGQPLMSHLAANGWVCVNANYRLSPKVEYPGHLVDCKAALAWMRDHADELGIDPEFICVTGGSAGGHLAALVGLTANDPTFQPGFTETDTSVAAAVPFYGVYDFTDEAGNNGPEFIKMLERMIMRRSLEDHRQDFLDYSPMHRVHRDAPPFMIIHGELDTLAPVAEARRFRTALDDVSEQEVVYLELEGTQHAFDGLWSNRTRRTIEGVERFLRRQWTQHLEHTTDRVAADTSRSADASISVR